MIKPERGPKVWKPTDCARRIDRHRMGALTESRSGE